MTLRTKLLTAGLVILGTVYAWDKLREKDKLAVDAICAPVLQPNEKAKVIIDTKHKTIETVTDKGTKTTYLGDHSSVTLDKQGNLTVVSRTWGTEVAPFIGLSYGDKMRLAAGAGLLYFHKWDLNVGLAAAVSGGGGIKAFAAVSYNVYNNSHLFVGVDNKLNPIGGFAVRF